MKFPYILTHRGNLRPRKARGMYQVFRGTACVSQGNHLTSLEVRWQQCALGPKAEPINVGMLLSSPLERKQKPSPSWHKNTCSLARALQHEHLNTAHRTGCALPFLMLLPLSSEFRLMVARLSVSTG